MDKMPHIQLDAGIKAVSAILPGDPARVDAIAEFLTDVREEAFSREYKSITGTYKGSRILAISTGMGGPSAAICVEELANIGIKNIIRIGSCGALQQELSLGQLVICDRAVCDDGTSQTYLDYFRYASLDYSLDGAAGTKAGIAGTRDGAAGDMEAICFSCGDDALRQCCVTAAKALQIPWTVGATRCHDALYLRQKPRLDEFYSGKGILASDMETAAIFAVSALRGIRAASILNVVVEWKRNIGEGISSYKDGEAATADGEKNEILTALEALRLAVL
ncbi:MAG: nucleoside phosphorylase [Lachnospiraceae bacterium]|nr:nucleoside phosphorylase [Lachnospiraceae bacterium]